MGIESLHDWGNKINHLKEKIYDTSKQIHRTLQKGTKIDYSEAREWYEQELLKELEIDFENLEETEKEDFKKAFSELLGKRNFKNQKEIWQGFMEERKEFIPISYGYQPKEYKQHQIPRKSSLKNFFNTFLSEPEDYEEPYSIDDDIPEYDDYDN